jgi:hypothetical protein
VRRKAHAEFAQDWDAALRAHAARAKAEEAETIAALRPRSGQALKKAPSPSHGCAVGPSLSREGRGAKGEELIASGGRVKRVGHGRWNKRKEAIFFEELAATANATMAAKAAGVSPNAVFARRLKHPLFRAKWEAVVRASKASIDLYLVEETRKTFDPGTLDTGAVTPRVTIDQAIRISQLNASKKKGEELPDPFTEQAASMTPDDIHALREKLVRKIMRLRDRERPRMIAAGWSFDEEYDHMVPPGWSRPARPLNSKQ